MKGNIQVQTRKLDSFLYSVGTPTIYIYSGTMQSTTATFTLANYTSSLLLTFGPLPSGWTQRDSSSPNLTKMYMKNYPSTAVASGTGVASWFCLYNNSTLFMLGDVSDTTGAAILKLLTTSIVSGTSYDLYSFAFELKQ